MERKTTPGMQMSSWKMRVTRFERIFISFQIEEISTYTFFLFLTRLKSSTVYGIELKNGFEIAIRISRYIYTRNCRPSTFYFAYHIRTRSHIFNKAIITNISSYFSNFFPLFSRLIKIQSFDGEKKNAVTDATVCTSTTVPALVKSCRGKKSVHAVRHLPFCTFFCAPPSFKIPFTLGVVRIFFTPPHTFIYSLFFFF